MIRRSPRPRAVRTDGTPGRSRAAAATIARKRAVFHDALGCAVALGLLLVNPLGRVRWNAARAAMAINPQTIASPSQVRTILANVARLRPELTAFFGYLYYAALRPEEAVALRRANLVLPRPGRGKLILTGACPGCGPSAAPGSCSPARTRGRSRPTPESTLAGRRDPLW